TALRLAKDFAAVVLVARNRANLEDTARAVQAAGAQSLVVALDLSDPGAARRVDLFEMSDEAWHAGLALKLHGARRLTIAAWPALKAAKGSVVLISGNSAQFPKAPYAAVGTIH